MFNETNYTLIFFLLSCFKFFLLMNLLIENKLRKPFPSPEERDINSKDKKRLIPMLPRRLKCYMKMFDASKF